MNQKEFYDSLSEDIKERLKACKTEEEMMKVLDEEKIELDPGLLDEASGGALKFRHDNDCDRCDKSSC